MTRKFKTILMAFVVAVIPLLDMLACLPTQAAQTALPAVNTYLTNPSTAVAEQGLEDTNSVIRELIGGAAESSDVTLASDAFAPSVNKAIYPLLPQTGTADDLATITTSSCRNGSVVICRNANSANTVTVKTGTGNIVLSDGNDLALNATNDYVALVLRTSTWYELYRSSGGRIKALTGGQAETTATIASGMLPIAQASNMVAGEGSAADNLDGISSTAMPGSIAILRCADASDAISVRHNQSVTAGYYKILTADAATVTLDSLTKYIILHKDVSGTAWREIARGGFIPEAPASANKVLATATSGADALPTMRHLVLADQPTTQTLPQQVRLYTTSGNPNADGGPVASTTSTVYIGPYGGNVVSLPDSSGDVFTQRTFSQLSLSVGSDEFRIYDVFMYDNAGTVAVEKNAWDSGGATTGSITGISAANPAVITSNNSLAPGDKIYIYGVTGTMGTDTTRMVNKKIWTVATATGTTITLQTGVGDTASLAYTSGGTWVKVPAARTDALTWRNGFYLKNSDKTRVYVGTIMLGGSRGSGLVQDDDSARCCWSYFNRQLRRLITFTGLTGTSHTYTTASSRAFERSTSQANQTGTRFNFVIGIEDETHLVSITQMVESTAAGGIARASLSLDSVGGDNIAVAQTNVINQAIAFSHTQPVGNSRPPIGAHVYQYGEHASGGTSMTWHSGGTFPCAVSVLGRY